MTSIPQRPSRTGRPGPERDDRASEDAPSVAAAPRLRLTRQGLVLVLVVFALLAMSVHPLREYVAQRERVAELEVRQAALTSEITALEDERARLEDPEYVEQVAREELHMARPGEEVWVMSGEPPQDPAVEPGSEEEPERPWYERLRDTFLG